MTKICKDPSCTTFGNINWNPTINANTGGASAVTITDTGLTGNIWGDEIGWVNLAPTGSGVIMNPSNGQLSGYAYANTGGWINFRPTQVAGNPPVGVSINSSGEFVGYAYVSGLNGGWMKFDCASGSTCIKTDWIPAPYRPAVISSSANTGGVVGLQYITQPTQPQPIATSTSTTTTPQNPDNIEIPAKPKYPTTHIPTTPGKTYPGFVSSSTNPNLSESTTTLVDIDGQPMSITISIRPHSNTSANGQTSQGDSGSTLGRSKGSLLSYPFVPERAKWKIPTSHVLPSLQAKAHVTIPDVDGTSILLTLVAGAFLWKVGALALLMLARLF